MDEKYDGRINAVTEKSGTNPGRKSILPIISMVKHRVSCLRTVLRSMYRMYWIQRLPVPSNFPLLTRRELFDFLDELRDIWLWLGLLSVLFFSNTSWQLYDVWVTVNIGCTLPESSVWLRETQGKQTAWSIGSASWFCFYKRDAAPWKIHWLNIHYPIARTSNVLVGYIFRFFRGIHLFIQGVKDLPRLISNKALDCCKSCSIFGNK